MRRRRNERVIYRHILKLNERFALEILRGHKRFEVRINDRCFQRGDEVQFRIVDADGNPYIENLPFPYLTELEDKVFRITFVVTGYGLEKGYCAFGFEEVKPAED
ncbi:MAG: DUF3850 domain-containing protein [Lachnospiraceae bacterium]|nr:DUF3850 domain-containing protein [Lachnospiraceae bacterium]